MVKKAPKRPTAPASVTPPKARGHDPVALKGLAYGVFDASSAVMHHLTTPVAFYNAQSDLLVAQRRMLSGLPGNKELVLAIEAAADALSARADAYRADNRWDTPPKMDGPRAN